MGQAMNKEGSILLPMNQPRDLCEIISKMLQGDLYFLIMRMDLVLKNYIEIEIHDLNELRGNLLYLHLGQVSLL